MIPHERQIRGAGVSPALPGVPRAVESSKPKPPFGKRNTCPTILLCALCCFPVLLSLTLCGCVTKTKANAQSRAAYLAGQQQAVARMQQAQGPSVTINGEVRNHVVPWTQGLTLAQAVVAAEYTGAKDPGQIIIVHRGIATRVDPRQLLSGVDIPLQAGDIVQLMPPAEPPKQ
jgi:molybdopterin converting factor small subunit